ncbi:hypothetical protein K449DRAFT_426227 [Hypoxylon sp. EC38]|nr:hypothetical protein K449DRAFT_426227 [Hypoxylon sp. EC38]
MPNSLDRKLQKNLDRAVKKLLDITQNPSTEVSYPTPVLRQTPEDESQLANHMAFLAQSHEGAKYISAACVEEMKGGSVIRLASNETPSEHTRYGLGTILNTMKDGITQGFSRDTLRETIFDHVMNLSQERIIQRIRPRWSDSPTYYNHDEEPLWHRINTYILQPMKPTPPNMSRLIPKIHKLLSALILLETPEIPSNQYLRDSVRVIVRCCATISCSGDYGSLREQLRDIPGGQGISGSKEIAQIDKLARYFLLSQDLAELAQIPRYCGLIQNISLEYLSKEMFHVEGRKGYFIHAEVQLILYYERQSLEKPPRAIGCSKSSCFLCDLLIQKLEKYHISYTHGRLYKDWKIPYISWIPSKSVEPFRSILRSMITQMKSLSSSQSREFKPFGLESRAVLPLSTHLTSSRSTMPFSAANPSRRLCHTENVGNRPWVPVPKADMISDSESTDPANDDMHLLQAMATVEDEAQDVEDEQEDDARCDEVLDTTTIDMLVFFPVGLGPGWVRQW